MYVLNLLFLLCFAHLLLNTEKRPLSVLLRRTVPYGMSSYRGRQRKRRGVQPSQHEGAETPRCRCVVTDADPECRDFCLSRSV